MMQKDYQTIAESVVTGAQLLEAAAPGAMKGFAGIFGAPHAGGLFQKKRLGSCLNSSNSAGYAAQLMNFIST